MRKDGSTAAPCTASSLRTNIKRCSLQQGPCRRGSQYAALDLIDAPIQRSYMLRVSFGRTECRRSSQTFKILPPPPYQLARWLRRYRTPGNGHPAGLCAANCGVNDCFTRSNKLRRGFPPARNNTRRATGSPSNR